MSLRQSIYVSLLLLVFGGGAGRAFSDQVTTIVGFNTVPCKAGSDTIASVPFHLVPKVESDAIAGTPSINGEEATFSVKNSPDYSVNAFASEPHYLRFLSGDRSGSHYRILSHTDSTITVDRAGESYSGVAEDDLFAVIPYWTLNTLFPAGSQSTIHVSTGVFPPQRGTRILFFDHTSDGVMLAPDRIYFLTASGWKQSEKGFPDAGETILPPHTPFVIRHPGGSSDTTFYPMQIVDEGPSASAIRERSAGPQDTAVALVRPIDVELRHLGLGGGFVDSTSNDGGGRGDELLVYDSLTQALNRKPATTYFRVAGEWRRDDGASYPVSDTAKISPSNGLVVRKKAGNDTTLRWLNTPRY